MDFADLFPMEFHPALAWLGRKPWINYKAGEDFRVIIKPNLDVVTPSQEEKQKFPTSHWDKVKKCVEMVSQDSIRGMYMLSVSRLLGYGPKMFQPTFEDCLSSLDTTIGLKFEEYRQPYDALIIELPHEFREHLKKEYRLPQGPKYIIPFHDIRKSFVCVSCVYSTNNILCNLIPNRPEYRTIQNCFDLNRSRTNIPADDVASREMQAGELVERLAMNFSLIMTLKGIRQGGPSDQRLGQQIVKLAKSKNTLDQKKAQVLKIGVVNLIKLHQDIKIYADVIEGREDRQLSNDEVAEGRATGKLIPAHWRSGHHKLQPYGPRNSERKRVYIQRLRVNKWLDDMAGAPDLSLGSVTYRLKNKHPTNGGTSGQEKAAS